LRTGRSLKVWWAPARGVSLAAAATGQWEDSRSSTGAR